MSETAFPDWRACHLKCVVCQDHVPVHEAAETAINFMKYSLHETCEDKWDSMDNVARQEHRRALEIMGQLEWDARYDLGEQDGSNEYWRQQAKE